MKSPDLILIHRDMDGDMIACGCLEDQILTVWYDLCQDVVRSLLVSVCCLYHFSRELCMNALQWEIISLDEFSQKS